MSLGIGPRWTGPIEAMEDLRADLSMIETGVLVEGGRSSKKKRAGPWVV